MLFPNSRGIKTAANPAFQESRGVCAHYVGQSGYLSRQPDPPDKDKRILRTRTRASSGQAWPRPMAKATLRPTRRAAACVPRGSFAGPARRGPARRECPVGPSPQLLTYGPKKLYKCLKGIHRPASCVPRIVCAPHRVCPESSGRTLVAYCQRSPRCAWRS